MKKFLITAVIAMGIASGAQAQIISSATVIPDANVLINLNNSGLDWVYAGPIGPDEWGPGNIQPATYRAAEGWRVATANEWAMRPLWTDFIVAGNPGGIGSPPAGYSNHAGYIFASEYWGNFYHVDINDYANGYVTDGVNGGPIGGVPETIYVRNTLVVPEPETYGMLIAGLGILSFLARRRKA
ncbi:hypothetical protein Jab_2c04330 [Janthinobacterium sp. HH01]|uniref:PEP-CTERM sorting domain-containing protein n=1 Tax=Janthinobacterium sp. HH01 TaxID=1198452 RepID=UPI0002AEBD83|nr:PEP-CTERM sorting domain-containing protein [Janthinobacterium sp. HH01]ELX08385.1 hypothetical protein Jab_2c04330 [Janthinobacterium sp. HH01]